MNSIPSLTRRRFLGQLSIGAAAIALSRRLSAEEAGPSKKLGIALVGLGSYATRQLAPALQHTKLCRLAGAVTGSREKGEKLAREYGFSEKNVYGYDTMAQLAENKEIDI